MQLKCQPATTDDDLESCFDVRRKVFVEEQHVPVVREQDGWDQEARHFLTKADGKVVAACRVRFLGSAAKIERVAVLKDYRGHGIGMVLMKHIIQEVGRMDNIQLFKLSAQADTLPFYEKLGFKKRGNEYLDAGIPHYDMILEK